MAKAFELDVRGDRLAVVTFDLPGKKVNIFNQAVLEELEALIASLAARRDIGALVLLSGKDDNFIAGADVEAISGVTDPAVAEAGSRAGHRVFAAWEALPFPTVAAIRATCVGGGTELSLASTYRLASDRPSVAIGLPEVRLGILPGWGGCVRLPRLVGASAALDLILTGKTLDGKRALKIGLVDALVPDAAFLATVRDFALARLDQKKRPPHAGGLKAAALDGNPIGRSLVYSQARKQTLAQTAGQYPAPLRAIEVVRIGLEKGREAGFDAEARAIGELATSKIAKNLIHVFQLMEGVKRPEARPSGTAREVKMAAVLGAGVMGGGIAQLIADKVRVPVRLKDLNADALAKGMDHAAQLFRKQVERRRLSKAESARRLALLRPTLDNSGLSRADLVIEAIVENLGVKQKVFAETAVATGPAAILASNTSSLSIDAIGAQTPHRERVVGMHFFNPVDKMPLVEVIAGDHTHPEATATVWDFTRKLGKTPVLVKDGPGFLVNRLLMFYSAEALWLLDEGYRIEDIDHAMKSWGMPMGPLALTDEVGIDVAVKVAHILHDAFRDRLPLPAWLDRVQESGRLGSKNGKGFYRYEGRTREEPDLEVYKLLGLTPSQPSADPAALVDRMVLPMVNEAARCLEERIVADAGDLDLALIMGTGFPPFRGGLCRWADGVGLPSLIETLQRFSGTVGERYRPSAPLQAAAKGGGFYARFGRRK